MPRTILHSMPGVGRETSTSPTFLDQPPGRDRRIAELANRQHGVVTLTQLRKLGLSAGAVRTRATKGRLHRMYRGVYAVGHLRLTREGHWMAAVFACGPSALLSHRSAAALWGLRQTSRSAIDVTVPRGGGRSLPGMDIHRSSTVAAADATRVRGIACTTVARTLLDLAEVVSWREVERSCEQAEIMQILDMEAVEDVLDRAVGRRGAPVLRAIFDGHAVGETLTRSELEERFLALCLKAGLPRPRVNQWVTVEGEPMQVDFLWPVERVAAETDGYAAHGTPAAFERDRRRDQLLSIAGWQPVRFTWRQVVNDPREVIATLRQLLAR